MRRRPPLSAALLSLSLLGLGLGLGAYAVWPLLRPPNPARPFSTLLVLGAAQASGRPSAAFQRRLDHALALYRSGGVERLIVSGGVGKGQRQSEGEVGLRYLKARGVPEHILRAETRSRTTYQNLHNSRSLIEGSLTLVTDALHAPRALALARAEGFEVNVSSVRIRPAPRYLLRETAARLAWRLAGYTGGRRTL